MAEADDRFWIKLQELNKKLAAQERIQELRRLCASESCPSTSKSDLPTRSEILNKLEDIIVNVCGSLAAGVAPCLTYVNRNTWSNTEWDASTGVGLAANPTKTTLRFDSASSSKKFAKTMKVIELVYRLVQTDTYCTKRDIYYQNVNVFGCQTTVDEIIDNISCMLAVPRWTLHVLATTKGRVAGDLRYFEADGNFVDCSLSNSGVPVPVHVQGVYNIESNAKFILVVEKDASFQRLLDDEVCHKLGPCIVVTGKGFPDVNTRMMLKLLYTTLHIPVLALVDADPHGIEIMTVYKYGSKSMAFDATHLTVPSLQWLGVLPTDITNLHIPSHVLVPLTTADRNKARDLLARPHLASHPKWVKQVKVLLETGCKAEIQCLSAISMNFLTDVYLPNKIQQGGWI